MKVSFEYSRRFRLFSSDQMPPEITDFKDKASRVEFPYKYFQKVLLEIHHLLLLNWIGFHFNMIFYLHIILYLIDAGCVQQLSI